MGKVGFSILAAVLTAGGAAAKPHLPKQLTWPTFAYPVTVEQINPQGVQVEAPGRVDVLLPPGLVYQMAGEPIPVSALRAGQRCEVVMPAGQGQLLNFDGTMATVVSPYGIAPIPIHYLPQSYVPQAFLQNPAVYQQPQPVAYAPTYQQPVAYPEPAYYPHDPYAYESAYNDYGPYDPPYPPPAIVSTGYLFDTRPVRPVMNLSAGDLEMNLGEANPMYSPYFGGSDSWSLGFNPLTNSLSVAAPSNTFNPLPWALPALGLAPIMWAQPAPVFIHPQPTYLPQQVQHFWSAPPLVAPWQHPGRRLGWYKQQQRFSWNSWQAPQAQTSWAVTQPGQWQRPVLNWAGARPRWTPAGNEVRYGGGGGAKRQWSGSGSKRQWSGNGGGGSKRQWSGNAGGGSKRQWSGGGGSKRQWSGGGGSKRQWSGKGGGSKRWSGGYGGGGGRRYSGGGGGGHQRGGGGKRGK